MQELRLRRRPFFKTELTVDFKILNLDEIPFVGGNGQPFKPTLNIAQFFYIEYRYVNFCDLVP